MGLQERRRRFFIDQPLQLRYMLTVSTTLLLVTLVSLTNIYFGIWGGILNALSDEQIRNDLLTAARIQEYEEARHPGSLPPGSLFPFPFFRQMERLSERQREVFKELLDQTNQKLAGQLLLLMALIAWGTVFLSHKIAGPLYRFQVLFENIRQGDLAVRCKLRRFDEAKPVADAFNRTLEYLDLTLARLKNLVRENETNPPNLQARLKEELSRFKTSP